ncbi:bacteriophage T4 gp5 trimerisation domain-containing protein, partial [Vibrio metschnikovii]|nr:type VI secretion system tip protein VgrG [Vibrio metschnikovii]
KHDKHLTVENDEFSHIHHHQHLTVDGERRLKVGQDQSVEVGGALQQKVATLVAIESGREISLKAGAKIVVEAGAEITLKAGGSFVKVDGGGVHLVGAAINLNSGGSAGSASRYAGQLAQLPHQLKEQEPPMAALPLQLSASMFGMISVANIDKVKLCQRQADGSCLREDCPCLSQEEA